MAKTEKAAKTASEKKSANLPSKATMNFARRKSEFNYKKMLPLIAVLIVAVAVFVKYGMLDPLDRKVNALNELSAKQSELAVINAKLADYDEVSREYGRYSFGWMTDSEKNTVSRMDILELIENKIMPYSGVEDFAVNSNVLTLNLKGITLEQTSSIVKLLEQDELVESASVYSATAEADSEAEVFMSVVLTNNKEAE